MERTPTIRPDNESAWAQYSVEIPHRDAIREKLDEVGVPTAVFYPLPLHLQDAFSDLDYNWGDLPVCEAASRRIIALPMHPYLDEETQDFIVEQLDAALAEVS